MARIVVVDDLDEMRMLFEDLFASWGHEVISFDDGAPAIDGVDYSAVDLVVTDLKMPTPGQVVIQTLRALGHDLPIVVVSAHVDGIEQAQLLSLGVQAVIPKPPDFRMLKETISDLLICSGRVSCHDARRSA